MIQKEEEEGDDEEGDIVMALGGQEGLYCGSMWWGGIW